MKGNLKLDLRLGLKLPLTLGNSNEAVHIGHYICSDKRHYKTVDGKYYKCVTN